MEINDIIKLTDGRRGKILATPSGFLSNGAYEVMVDGEKMWIDVEQVLYTIDTKYEDDINEYFEIIYDEHGVHLIPKVVEEITVDDDNEMTKSINFKLDDSRVHSNITIHVGDSDVWSSTNPKPKPQKKKKKINLL